MHELSLAVSILDTVVRNADGRRVKRVRVEVGALTCVRPETLASCFEMAREGTVAAEAELEILRVPGRAVCRACDRELALDRPYGRCVCGGTALDLRDGEQLLIRDMEIV